MVPGTVANFRTSKNQLSKAEKKLLRKAGRDLAAAGQPQALANLRARAKQNGFAQGGNRAVMHVPTTRGNNGTVVAAPQSVGRRMQSEWIVSNGSRRGSIRVKGQDWLGRITASLSEVPGYVYLEIYINPLEIAGTRLSLFAQLYDKYRFGMLKFHFVPAGSTQTRGAVLLAYDRDISDATPPPNDNGVRQFMAMMDSVSSPIWAPCTAVCPLSHPEEGLWCNPVAGGDDRLSYQGQLYIACMEPSSLAAGQSIGDLFMEYDVEFFDPQLDQTVPIANIAVPSSTSPDPGDLLKTLAPNAGFGAGAYSGTPGLMPKIDPVTLKGFLDAAQGVYRLTQAISQAAGLPGAIVGSPPVVIPNVTRAPPAPQPIVTMIRQLDADPASDVSSEYSEFIVAVPPGGGKIFWNLANSAGVSTASDQYGTFEKISPNWFDPVQALF